MQGIRDESGMGRAVDAPSGKAAREDVDDQGHMDEADRHGDIDETAPPQHVRGRHADLALHRLQRAGSALSGRMVLIFLPRRTLSRATLNPSRRIWRQTWRSP